MGFCGAGHDLLRVEPPPWSAQPDWHRAHPMVLRILFLCPQCLACYVAHVTLAATVSWALTVYQAFFNPCSIPMRFGYA